MAYCFSHPQQKGAFSRFYISLYPTDFHRSVPKFRRVLSGPSLLAAKLGTVSPRFASVGIETGTRIEVSPKAYDLSKQVAEHISSSSSGGAALFVDYGGDQWFGSSARVSSGLVFVTTPLICVIGVP